MILLIWSIYILISGKLQISRTYGVKGSIARFVGAFYLLTSLGLVGAVIPIPITDPVQNMLVSFGIQILLIVIAPLVAVAIHGNDFADKGAGYCPACGAEIKENQVVCTACGVILKAESPVAKANTTNVVLAYILAIFFPLFGFFGALSLYSRKQPTHATICLAISIINLVVFISVMG